VLRLPHELRRFQQVTIARQQHPNSGEEMYRIQVEGTPENLWTEPGWYKTLDDAFKAFDFPLRTDVQATIREAFKYSDRVKFRLKSAF
jgi:hypothetical protein